MEETFSISRLAKHQISIGGASRSYEFIAKLVRDYNIQPAAESKTGTPEYSVKSLEAAYQLYSAQKEEDEEDDSLAAQYNRAKLEHKIEQAKNVRLINAQLERDSVSVQEMVAFWKQRRAIELAILRKIFIIDMPMHIPGLSHADARTRGEQFYNKFVKASEETLELWSDKYTAAPDEEIVKKLETLISKAEESPISGSVASGSIHVEAHSGSIDTPMGGS
jgi:hypothetical protein